MSRKWDTAPIGEKHLLCSVFQGTTQEELGRRFEHGFKRVVIEETILDLKSDDEESEDKQVAGWRRSGQVNREWGVGKGAGRLRDDGQAE